MFPPPTTASSLSMLLPSPFSAHSLLLPAHSLPRRSFAKQTGSSTRRRHAEALYPSGSVNGFQHPPAPCRGDLPSGFCRFLTFTGPLYPPASRRGALPISLTLTDSLPPFFPIPLLVSLYILTFFLTRHTLLVLSFSPAMRSAAHAHQLQNLVPPPFTRPSI